MSPTSNCPAIEREAPELDVAFTDWKREPGKTGRKDSYAASPGARLVRKVRRALDAVDPSLQLTFDLTPDVESFPLRRLVADGAADAAVPHGHGKAGAPRTRGAPGHAAHDGIVAILEGQ